MFTLNTKKKEKQPTLRLPKIDLNLWDVEQINDTQYLLRLRANIVQTGSEFNTDYIIPMHHRLLEMAYYHYLTGGATLATSNMTFKWYVRDGGNYKIMWNKTNVGYSSANVRYQDEVNGGTDFGSTVYRFTTNGDATDELAVTMRLEVLKW
jgi:hypothetical protein